MAKNNCRLFIYGIDENVSNSDLKAKFGEHGWITDTYNTGKGYAFVTFYHQSSADRVIKDFHGESLFGKRVKVEVAKPRAGDDARVNSEDGEHVDSEVWERIDSEDEQRIDSEDEQRIDCEDEHRVDSEDDDDSEDSDDECNDDDEDRGDTMMGLMRKVEKSMLKLNLSELKWDGWLVKRE